LIVPLTARAWIQIVPRVAPAPTSKGSKIATRSGCVIFYDKHPNPAACYGAPNTLL
jgi:hypothetical protein